MRASNFELLRIFCMFFIFFHHLLVYVLEYQKNSGCCFYISMFIDAFIIIAVNCFVILSGYWSIKVKFCGVLSLYLMCCFYNLLSIMISYYIFDNSNLALSEIMYCFFPFSHPSGLWFVQIYFYLYLLSPLLNFAVENRNVKDVVLLLALLIFLNVYFGFLWRDDINESGTGIMNFLLLYLIGRFLREHCSHIFTNNFYNVGIYICTALLVFIIGSLEYIYMNGKLHYGLLFGYNSPVIIIESVFFFLIFRNMKIKSNKINWLSCSVFSVYLMHENIHVRSFIYSRIALLINDFSIEYKYLILVVLSALFFVVAILVDKVRIFLIAPVEKKLNMRYCFLHNQLYSFIFKDTRK